MGAAAEILKRRLEEVFFGEMEIKVVRDPEIEVMKSGKTKFVVREDR